MAKLLGVRPEFPRAKSGDTFQGWKCVEDSPFTGLAEWMKVEADAAGNPERIRMMRIQHNTEAIIKDNKAMLADNQGKRWGDGKVVATVPMALYEVNLQEAVSNGDSAYINKWLSNGDHRDFRRFGGNL